MADLVSQAEREGDVGHGHVAGDDARHSDRAGHNQNIFIFLIQFIKIN
jgi:hypothetical protein